jgi:hypothetical protein
MMVLHINAQSGDIQMRGGIDNLHICFLSTEVSRVLLFFSAMPALGPGPGYIIFYSLPTRVLAVTPIIDARGIAPILHSWKGDPARTVGRE